MKKPIVVLILLFGILVQTSFATDGYYRHGYGIKYSALAGSGIAVSLSSLGAINNPASIVNLNDQFEINLSLFSPMRDYTITGNPSGFEGTFGLTPGQIESEQTMFFFPTLGGNMKIADNMAIALSIYGNGGMNTDYPTQTFYDPNSPATGINLEQMFVSGSYAIEFVKNHSLGASVVFGWQRFAAKGLIAFSNFSSDPANLTGNAFSTSTGFGFKLGYQGQLTEWLRIGAALQTSMMMSEFDRYAGLFAEQGDFDVPASWTAGVAVMPTKDWNLLLDVKQILYSSIKSVGNPFMPNIMNSQLGNDDGAGFGWKDILAVKFGVMYTGVAEWDFMAGYSYNENPIPDTEVMFNILAPAVIQNHITAGITKQLGNQHEVSLAFMYALDNSVTGPNPLEAPNQQTIEISMQQWQVEIGYAFSFVK